METVIYYFSGTGNSLSIAQTIKKQIDNCTLRPMVGALNQKPIQTSAQSIGLVFPTHFMTLPRIVVEFLQEVQFSNLQYLFLVATGSNPRYGNVIADVGKHLTRLGMQLNAAYLIPTVAAHFPYISKPRRKAPSELYQEMQNKALTIAQKVVQLTNTFDTEFGLYGKLYHLLRSQKTIGTTDFYRDKGCILCGYCMHVCPFSNIRLHGNEVQWKENCHSCFACVHFCSQGVIQYKKLSVGKPRQHHPMVHLGDIASQKR